MPITINPTKPSGEIFAALMAHDENVRNIDRTATFRFNSGNPVNTLIGLGATVNLDGAEWDFDLVSGVRSLARRGFYKITGDIHEALINNIPTWRAKVLYSPSQTAERYFTYLANVGPMINVNGLGFNASTNPTERLITSRLPNGAIRLKGEFFFSMLNRVFYVSQQATLNDGMKQTAWFLF